VKDKTMKEIQNDVEEHFEDIVEIFACYPSNLDLLLTVTKGIGKVINQTKINCTNNEQVEGWLHNEQVEGWLHNEQVEGRLPNGN